MSAANGKLPWNVKGKCGKKYELRNEQKKKVVYLQK